ncbi:MAG: single-stranded DNA-binding protein [Fusobacteriales bacterium]|nr:single-stranded DNA-binding protein [Fusobacteriales bacterium]
MNIVVLSGYIATPKLELKQTENKKTFLRFSLAISNGKNKEGKQYNPDFILCEAWEERAMHIVEYYEKGKGIELTGKIKQDKWEDPAGNKRSRLKVLVDKIEFPKSNKPETAKATEPHDWEPGGKDNDTLDDDDFPF